jgi:hypothetical protein
MNDISVFLRTDIKFIKGIILTLAPFNSYICLNV